MNIIHYKSFFNEVKKMSLIFKNFNNHFNSELKYSYVKKSSFLDGLLFLLLKTQINKTQSDISIELSFKNKQKISRQSFIKRSHSISLNHLCILENKIKSLFPESEHDRILIDGTNINIYNKNTIKGYENINILGVYNDNNTSLDLFMNN